MADAQAPSASSEHSLAPPAEGGLTPKPLSPGNMAEPNGTSNTLAADLSAAAMTNVRPGGAPARVYLNEKIVPHLLEGMKVVARDQPANPLHTLGKFLLQRSSELEGESKE